MSEDFVAKLKGLLKYDPETGAFTWLVKRKSRAGYVLPGSVAGSVHKRTGYREIGIEGKLYLAHRLAWLYVHGEWPDNLIDHKDGERDNNKLSNLRQADRSINGQNMRGPRKDGTSGYLGVTWSKQRKKWAAQISVDGKHCHLGLHESPEIASNAYLSAKRNLHVGCTI